MAQATSTLGLKSSRRSTETATTSSMYLMPDPISFDEKPSFWPLVYSHTCTHPQKNRAQPTPSPQLRLYYVDASNKVVELAQDLDAADPTKVKRDWYVGDMTKQGYEARPQTSITAHVNEYEKPATIKVYFFAKDARRMDRPTVAWYDVKKDGKWQILDEGCI